MKIIFDSEEQKEQFQKLVLNQAEVGLCPSSLYLKERCVGILSLNDPGYYKRDCKTCWENCGIEMEVAGNATK